MSIRLSCPSCNTAFALPTLPEHRRATCPRCGDVFPIHTYTESEDSEQRTEDRGQRTEDNQMIFVQRRTLYAKLLLGLVMFCLTIGLAIYFKCNKSAIVQREPLLPPPTLSATPPAQLAALGYLHPDCNAAFAVQVGPLFHYAERTKQEPSAVFAQVGLPDAVWNTVNQFGVPLEQIDHIAGGIYLGEGEDALRLTLALVLKQPLTDEAHFLATLKAKPVAGQKSRHSVVAGRFPLMLARAAPTIWVFGLDEKDLNGAAQLRGLRQMLASVPPEAAAWVIADDDRDWTQKPIVKAFSNMPELKKWLPALKDGRGGLVAVSLGEQPRMRVAVRTADSASSDRVRAYFAARAGEVEAATSSGQDRFAQFDAPFDSSSAKLLQRMLSDAGR